MTMIEYPNEATVCPCPDCRATGDEPETCSIAAFDAVSWSEPRWFRCYTHGVHFKDTLPTPYPPLTRVVYS